MLRTSDLDYHLPEELIATEPASPRDSARLLVLRRSDPQFVQHAMVRDLPSLLAPNDLLVVNQSHVLPARFRGVRTDTGGKAEGLFICEYAAPLGGPVVWQVLLKLRRTKPGAAVQLHDARGHDSPVCLRMLERVGGDAPDDSGGWLVAVEGVAPDETTLQVLERVGLTALPPYILAARRRQEEVARSEKTDRERYQTVYAEAAPDESHGWGSVAAPTAGLHFTPELLGALSTRGVSRASVTLHVGIGTFKPVDAEFVENHPMHAEWCAVPSATVEAIARAHAATPAGRVIAVGTTTARTLESFESTDEMRARPEKSTKILITPGHPFRHIEGLMTNFHLPRSTLLAMVAAFLDDDDRVRGQGLGRLLAAYAQAVEQRYRFYSFGDAMLILP
jgi:S-adenosylmethionine:tRNA ribosyltransferase-isomerase